MSLSNIKRITILQIYAINIENCIYYKKKKKIKACKNYLRKVLNPNMKYR